MLPPDVLKAKVCLVGEAAVGKTSLVRRFLEDAFRDRYDPTIGAKVAKREIAVEVDGRVVRAILTIWDVMGQPVLRGRLEDAWLSRVQGVLAVGDVTRPDTIRALDGWISSARRLSGNVPVLLVGNKVDLPSPGREDLTELGLTLGLPWWHTSAKTGENVDAAFQSLAEAIVRASFVQKLEPEPTVLAA